MTETTNTPLNGDVAPGFEPVRDAFLENFEDGHELGAGFAAIIEGQCVIDLRGGHADRMKSREWGPDTLVPVFSTTKPIAALTLALIVDRSGLKDGLDTRVAEVWPEFAANGKDAYTIAEVMSHQAGLPGFAEPIDPDLWFDPPALAAELARLAPMWPRGEGAGYHPLTWGFLIGEIARRIDGRTLGTVLREEITHRHGAEPIDFWIGLPDSEHDRVADMKRPTEYPELGEIDRVKRAAFLNKWAAPQRGGADWKRVESPASNGHGTARSTAQLFQLFANGFVLDGETLFSSPEFVREFTKSRVSGWNKVLPFDLDFAAGFMRNKGLVYGPNPASYGHSGWGGSMGLGDPDRQLSAAYVMNRQSNKLQGDPRARRLIAALYGCL